MTASGTLYDTSFICIYSYGASLSKIKYVQVNGNGESVTDTLCITGQLSDCAPVLRNGRVEWIAGDADKYPFLYSLSCNGISESCTASFYPYSCDEVSDIKDQIEGGDSSNLSEQSNINSNVIIKNNICGGTLELPAQPACPGYEFLGWYKDGDRYCFNQYVYCILNNEGYAFYDCNKLKRVTIRSKNLKEISTNSFKGLENKITVRVPKGKLSAYKKLLKV